LNEPVHAWPAPEAGQIVWCRFPQSRLLKPAPKPRPALIIQVFDDEAPLFRVLVAYGTSKKTETLYTGEFRIAPEDGEAYQLAGLSFPTKFNLASDIELPYNSEWFAVPPSAPFGQTPKLGILHPNLLRRVAAAWQAIERGRSD
jgi:hypothetical protein